MAWVYGTNGPEGIGFFGATNDDDFIFGLDGNDLIYGLAGNDTIKGGGGADYIDGGSGTDLANYSDSGEGVRVYLDLGLASGGTAEGDRLVSIENLTGSTHDDILAGDAGNNVLTGLDGNDVLKGGGGNDTLDGDNGSDVLIGSSGADVLTGGSGIDTASYNDSSAGVFISLYDDAAAYGDAAGDDLNSIENVAGSDYNHDDLWGDNGPNELDGRGGDDTLKGFGGEDLLLGGEGNDTLSGMDDNDTLYGYGGDDTLNGGAGSDYMEGGIGNDTYHLDSLGDVVTEEAGAGTDTVYSSVTYGLGANLENLTLTGTVAVSGIGNSAANVIVGNSAANAIDGGDGGDRLTGGGGNDVFMFTAHQANGDAVLDFTGNGAAVGDTLVFSGYGPGATFTRIDSMNWQVNYDGGASHDVISFLNPGGVIIDPSDYSFV
jgi:Ca2+-binding RTX toxin-like protein